MPFKNAVTVPAGDVPGAVPYFAQVRGEGGEQIYGRFPSKYFYLFGTTYYLNVYFRF